MGEPDNLLGRIFQDTYRIERLLGKGGMGVVYEASHLRLVRRFAIKLLSRQVADELRNMIIRGEYKTGDRLPPIQTMAQSQISQKAGTSWSKFSGKNAV